jgi:hypothetical protein
MADLISLTYPIDSFLSYFKYLIYLWISFSVVFKSCIIKSSSCFTPSHLQKSSKDFEYSSFVLSVSNESIKFSNASPLIFLVSVNVVVFYITAQTEYRFTRINRCCIMSSAP